MLRQLSHEIKTTMARDPAARSRLEVILCYPGFQAVILHRLAHRLWRAKWCLSARFLSQVGRAATGIEIHPAAQIGRGFFIDHGMGVVIGETSVIGDNVTLYQGVTLGGVAPAVDSESQRGVKRHPTLGNNVIVGSGAQILGPIDIECGVRVGANAVVTRSVACCTTVVGIPARAIGGRRVADGERQPFAAYGIPQGDLPDPLARTLEGLRAEIQMLRARVVELEDREDVQKTVPPPVLSADVSCHQKK